MTGIGAFSPYQIHQWLDDARTGWLALHYEDPRTAGAYASEVFGGSYARLAYEMTQPTDLGMFLSNDLLFNGLPAVTITHVAGWDDQNNGNYLWSAPLPQPRKVFSGKSLSLPAGTIGLSMA